VTNPYFFENIVCCHQYYLWSQHDHSSSNAEDQGNFARIYQLLPIKFLVQGMSEAKVEKIKVGALWVYAIKALIPNITGSCSEDFG
jgi:hypothetical protein